MRTHIKILSDCGTDEDVYQKLENRSNAWLADHPEIAIVDCSISTTSYSEGYLSTALCLRYQA